MSVDELIQLGNTFYEAKSKIEKSKNIDTTLGWENIKYGSKHLFLSILIAGTGMTYNKISAEGTLGDIVYLYKSWLDVCMMGAFSYSITTTLETYGSALKHLYNALTE